MVKLLPCQIASVERAKNWTPKRNRVAPWHTDNCAWNYYFCKSIHQDIETSVARIVRIAKDDIKKIMKELNES